MKRTGFTRQQPAKTPRAAYTPIPLDQRRGAAYARSEAPADPVPKDEPVRSKEYRRLVARFPCISCGKTGRSQHAHANLGKGLGLKVDDREGFPLCADEPGAEGCHTKFDQGKLFQDREAHRAHGAMWAAQTRAMMLERRLWPAGVPKWDEF